MSQFNKKATLEISMSKNKEKREISMSQVSRSLPQASVCSTSQAPWIRHGVLKRWTSWQFLLYAKPSLPRGLPQPQNSSASYQKTSEDCFEVITKTVPSVFSPGFTLSPSSYIFSPPQAYQEERNTGCAQKTSSVQRLTVPSIRKFPLASHSCSDTSPFPRGSFPKETC